MVVGDVVDVVDVVGRWQMRWMQVWKRDDLNEEESDTVGAEWSGRFDVGHFGFDLGECGVFLVLAEDLLLYGLHFDVRLRQELFQAVRHQQRYCSSAPISMYFSHQLLLIVVVVVVVIALVIVVVVALVVVLIIVVVVLVVIVLVVVLIIVVVVVFVVLFLVGSSLSSNSHSS